MTGYRQVPAAFTDYRDNDNPVRGIIVGAVCGLALWVLIVGVCVLLAAGNGRRLQEDDPGWNCQTMGNYHCGGGR